jgi:hypothetical protein
VRDRHAGQRRGLPGGPARIGSLGLCQCAVAIKVNEGAQLFVGGNPCEQLLRQFDAGNGFVLQRAAQVGHAELCGIAHSITFGTRNKPSSTAGALR